MKKLFSYLLISSMVVLSSCTNYDDQFDDLNAQINTLKSQIEGFSSLSSGLTALQGTVASLQTAINNIPVTPATDISGLESSLADLAATVEALQADLAAADNSDAIADLAADLVLAQADLAKLLAANNVFTGTLTINSASTLTAAESLGDKVSIISGDVVITHNTTVDNAKLQAVVSKMQTITGKLTYTQSGTGTTPVTFDGLTGVDGMDITQDGSISFPELASAGAVELNDNSDTAAVTGVDFPKLVSVTSFATGATANTIDFSKATKVDLASLVRYTQATLAITVNTDATIDLSALTTTNATDGKQAALGLTITGPDTLTLATYETGALTTDAEVVTLPKAASFPDFTGTNLKELHMHNLQGAATFTAVKHPNLEILDVIGAVTSGSTSSASTYAASVTVPTGTDLTTLTLAGFIRTASIDSANLESVTTSGGIQNVTIKNSTKMTTLTLGHTSKIGSYSSGSLTVTGNTKLESLTADSLDDISGLTITNNANLETISFDALNSIGTSATGVALTSGGALQVHTNNLAATNLQLASETAAAVTVAGKLTSASGISDLKAFIPLVAAISTSAKVQVDDLALITNAAGDELTAAQAITSGANKYVTWGGANTPWVLYNKVASSADAVPARYQTATTGLNVPATASNATTLSVTAYSAGVADAEFTFNSAWTSSISGYDASNPSTYMPALATKMNSILDAAGKNLDVTIANDYGISLHYEVNALYNGSEASTGFLTGAGRYIDFDFGGINATATVSDTTIDNSTDGLASAIKIALDAVGAFTSTYEVATTTANTLVFKPRISGTTTVDKFKTYTSLPALNFDAYNSTLSLTRALGVSNTIMANNVSSTKGWRLTVKNESQTLKANLLEAGNTFIGGSLSGTSASDLLTVAMIGGNALSNTSVYLPWANVAAAVGDTTPASTYTFVAWL